ncbi:hypothetical protein D3C81_2008910 [compost metagenome]
MGKKVSDGSLSGYSEAGVREITYLKDRDGLADSKNHRVNRTIVTVVMTVLVAIMNIAVFWLIAHMSMAELDLIKSKDLIAADRIIDGKVYMTLLAGTIAEVSALFVIILKSTFKS